MAKRATILLAGTLLATALCPAVATSQTFQQSSVDNQQTQNGDVTSSQTLDVVTVDQTTAVTTAGANGYSAAVQSGSLDVQSTQAANGNVTATSTVNGGSLGDASVTTAATGNSGEADSLGYADLTGAVHQSTAAVSIDAESQINAPDGDANSVNHSVQAVGNSQGIGVVGGSATMTVDQSNQATVQANGGAVMGYTGENQATFSSVATANNVTFTGTQGATSSLGVTQASTGDMVQATQFVAAGNGQSITGSSTAVANNLSATNENNPLDVTTNQTNSAYVRGQTEVSAYEFGAGSASATGVGNSAVVGNPGADLAINNTQVNTGGGVEVIASFSGTGGLGYDGYSSAAAMGNAVTGYACSTCKSKITVTNRQTNGTDISATSSVAMSSPARSATGVSTAMGNTATFYVSEPDN